MYSVVSIAYKALLSFVLFCLAEYWRLSTSMCVAMPILYLYYYNLTKWHITHNRRKTAYLTIRPKWHMRFQCEFALFILAILGLTLEYFCVKTLLSKAAYHSALTKTLSEELLGTSKTDFPRNTHQRHLTKFIGNGLYSKNQKGTPTKLWRFTVRNSA
jgi:hypothetical protein